MIEIISNESVFEIFFSIFIVCCFQSICQCNSSVAISSSFDVQFVGSFFVLLGKYWIQQNHTKLSTANEWNFFKLYKRKGKIARQHSHTNKTAIFIFSVSLRLIFFLLFRSVVLLFFFAHLCKKNKLLLHRRQKMIWFRVRCIHTLIHSVEILFYLANSLVGFGLILLLLFL